VIFVGIFFIILLVWGFCSFFGMLLGGVGYLMSERYKRLDSQPQEPLSHVHLLTPPTPYDWETDLEGWDGGEELDVDEEL